MNREIRPEELRIGNYVGFIGSLVRIEGIYKKDPESKKTWLQLDKYVDTRIDSLDLYLIPLSEEILLKCGFTKWPWCKDCVYIKYNESHMMLRLIDGKWRCSKIKVNFDSKGPYSTGKHQHILPKGKLKYLHQLQNLYHALTHKELKIEL